MSDAGYPAWQDAFAASDHFNALTFMMRQMMAESSHIALVLVKAVNANSVDGAPPTVNVQPMVAQVDQTGTAQEHGIVNNVPTFRAQSGTWAFVIDPQEGDIGVVICADRDHSSVLANQAPANPGSYRRFDWADSLYIGGFASIKPTQFVKIDDDGITVQADSGNEVMILADTISMVGADGSSDTSVSITGTLDVSVDVTADGVSLHDHVHGGVDSGPDETGPPV